jgi:hypothetical protein
MMIGICHPLGPNDGNLDVNALLAWTLVNFHDVGGDHLPRAQLQAYFLVLLQELCLIPLNCGSELNSKIPQFPKLDSIRSSEGLLAKSAVHT